MFRVPTHFRPFMLTDVITAFLLLAHDQVSQDCLYDKSGISLHVGLGDLNDSWGMYFFVGMDNYMMSMAIRPYDMLLCTAKKVYLEQPPYLLMYRSLICL